MIHTENELSGVSGDNCLEFLWLELTNRCNLRCTHCYAESGPQEHVHDLLGRTDYEALINESFLLGCRHLQFIGGEPTLNRDLPDLIRVAFEVGYSSIEVFTNLVSLPEQLLESFVRYKVKVATSVYSYESIMHDRVTQVSGSFEKTMRNIQRLLQAGVSVRAGVIAVDNNQAAVEATVSFLKKLGLEHVSTDRLRHFGRAKDSKDSCLSELCGNCAGNTLCIGPDGRISPCIMSKDWSVGSVLESSLTEIATSSRLSELRRDIYQATFHTSGGTVEMGGCNPDRKKTCNPDRGPSQPCNPCTPNGVCGPNTCQPVRKPK
jgi:MoaA/NifB/PqqE/SkfB family radical SAM enzyme